MNMDRLARASVSACAILALLPATDARPHAQSASGAAVALTNARLIDGTGRPAVESATIVLNAGRIESIGPSSTIKPPAGATTVDLAGKTVVPGFINAHGHLGAGDKTLSLREQILQQLRLYARYGVTTIQSLGDDGVESVKLHEEQARGALDRARLYTAGAAVVGESVDDAKQKVVKVASQRVNMIKTRMNRLAFADGSRTGSPTQFKTAGDMAPAVYRALIEQAHERKLRVAAHLFYLDQAKQLVDAGLDVIAHSIRDQDVDKAFVATLKAKNVGYIPTLTRDLAVFEFEASPTYVKEPFFQQGMPTFGIDLKEVSDPAFHEKIRASSEAQTTKKSLEQGMRNVKLLVDGGVTVAMGTDSGAVIGRWQGYNEHREIELMVKAGLSPMQALVSATGAAARALRIDEHVGTLERGKWADLIVLTANPLTDIRNTRKIDSVWIAGNKLTR